MNKSLFILLSSLTMLSNAANRDELRYAVDPLPTTAMASAQVAYKNRPMAGNGLRGGGPLAGAWGYSATKTTCYTAVAAAATYAVVQTGGAAAPIAKIIITKATSAMVGGTAGEIIVATAGAGAKAGTGAKAMASIGAGAAYLGSYLPWAIEGASVGVGAALTACPFLP